MTEQSISDVPMVKPKTVPAWLQHLIVFSIFIGIWEMAVQFSWVSALILPSPFAVVVAWWDLAVVRALIWDDFFVTLTEGMKMFVVTSFDVADSASPLTGAGTSPASS